MGRPLKPEIHGLLRRPLDRLFSVPANISVLRTLAGMNQGTGREVARRAGIGAPAAHQALSRLQDVGLVQRTPAGSAYLFVLNREHYFWKQILEGMFEAEAGFRKSLERMVAKAVGEPLVSAAIFGSVARGEEGPESDLDVVIIVEEVAQKEKASTHLQNAFERVWKGFGFKLSPMVVTRAEFVAGFRAGKGFYRNAVEEGEVFIGAQLQEVVGDSEGGKTEGRQHASRGLRRRRT